MPVFRVNQALCLLVLISLICCQVQGKVYPFNISFFPQNSITVGVDKQDIFYYNITGLHDNARNVTFGLRNYKVVTFTNHTFAMNDGVLSGEISIIGRRLGWTYLTVSYLDSAGKSHTIDNQDYQLVALRANSVLQQVYRYIVIVFVVILVLSMGCTITPKSLVAIIKRPSGLAVGAFSQFILMPHLALGIGQLLRLVPGIDEQQSFAFGILTMGCAPGGGSSNMFTYLFGGDLDLSVTMTFVSQMCALFMTPLWLFVYGRLYIPPESNITIPFGDIAINLLQVVIPVIVGILIKMRFPKFAALLVKVIKPAALLFIIFILTFGTYVNLYMYELIGDFPIIIPFAILLPWCGFLLGFCASKFIFRLEKKQATAIAIETGIQNIGIPMLVLLYSMPKPQGDIGAIVPLIIGIFTPMPLYIILIVKVLRKKFCPVTEENMKKYELNHDNNLDDVNVKKLDKNTVEFTKSTETVQDVI